MRRGTVLLGPWGAVVGTVTSVALQSDAPLMHVRTLLAAAASYTASHQVRRISKKQRRADLAPAAMASEYQLQVRYSGFPSLVLNMGERGVFMCPPEPVTASPPVKDTGALWLWIQRVRGAGRVQVERPWLQAGCCPCVVEAADRVTIDCWYQRQCGAVGVDSSSAGGWG